MKKNKDEELVSLNSELPQLYVEELEERLETDPLMIGGLFDTNLQADACIGHDICNGDGGCVEKENCGIQW